MPMGLRISPPNKMPNFVSQRKNRASKLLPSDSGHSTTDQSEEVKGSTGVTSGGDKEQGVGSRSNTEDEEEENNLGELWQVFL